MNDKIDLPEYLYKYIEPKVEKITNYIEGNSLWAADPNSFNDPFDCFPCIDVSITKEKSAEIFNLRSKKENIIQNRKNRRRFVTNFQKEIKKDWGSDLKKSISWKNTIEKIGVVCLSEVFFDILMWSHYASNHEGLCIQYSTKEIPINIFEKVEYLDDRPTFKPFDLRLSMLHGHHRDVLKEFFRKKAANWSYEKEWRYFIEIKKKTKEDIKKERVIKLNKNSIKGIFFWRKSEQRTYRKG
ncbi:DUF2971 domain-containing protein [Komagataeibacter europaeus]|uniref:DUF2971 domain-containing protein n=1 Tax=Komagataeibacter europaeus TaxID=33995 RepID=UPI0009D93A52|nr:DUF2971 domain-containing protein [Komagataeibacter europaeus]